MQEVAVEEQHPSRVKGRRHDASPFDAGVTDLPVATLEMHDRALTMAARDQVHAPIGLGRCIECDPHGHDPCIKRQVPVRMVLVPRLLTSEARWLDKGLVLEDGRFGTDHPARHCQKSRMGRDRMQTRVVLGEPGQLPDVILFGFRVQGRKDAPGTRLELHTPEPWHLPVNQGHHAV